MLCSPKFTYWSPNLQSDGVWNWEVIILRGNWLNFFFKIFLMWTIFKVFLKFVTIWILLYVVLRFWFFSYKTCGTLAAWPGIKYTLPVLEVKVLTGPPGKSQEIISFRWGFPCGSDGKESACNVRDWGSILGLGRSLGVGSGNPFQYSCLEN